MSKLRLSGWRPEQTSQSLQRMETAIELSSNTQSYQVGIIHRAVKEEVKPVKSHGTKDAHRNSKLHVNDQMGDFAHNQHLRKAKVRAHPNVFESYLEGEKISSKNVRITSADLKCRTQFLGRRAQIARLQSSWSSPDIHGNQSNSRDKRHKDGKDSSADQLSRTRSVLQEVKSLRKMMQKVEEEQKAKQEPPIVRPTVADPVDKSFHMAQRELFAMDDDDDEEEVKETGIEPTDAALAKFAEFVLVLGDGTLRGAFQALDPTGTGRVNAWDFTEFLKDHGFMGDADIAFRGLDEDQKGWIGLRDFQHLLPFMVLVQQQATQRRNSIEKKSKDLMKNFSFYLELPPQTRRTLSSKDSTLSLLPAELSVESKTAVSHRVASSGRSMVGPMKVKLFTNSNPCDTGVPLFVARPPRNMKHLFELCDGVCRPFVGKVCKLYDQSLRIVRSPAILGEGCAYLACGLEPLAPPAHFFNEGKTASAGASPSASMVPESGRASTAPTSKSHPQDSGARVWTAPLPKSQSLKPQSLGGESSWGQWMEVSVPLREPRRSSRPEMSLSQNASKRLSGGPEVWGFAETAPCLL